MIRLYVADAEVILTDDTRFEMKVPSGAQTGIKIFVSPEIMINAESTSHVLLDFDVNNSFVLQGNHETPAGIKGFLFTPVIKAVNMSEAGTISGSVTDIESNPLEGVLISAFQEDSLYGSTFSDETGDYGFAGLAGGSYTLTAELEGYTTAIIQNIIVSVGSETIQNFELAVQ